jgi:hypothetical protein
MKRLPKGYFEVGEKQFENWKRKWKRLEVERRKGKGGKEE